MTTVVGIDVGKHKLAVVVCTALGKQRHKSCPNTPAGHTDLLRWLTHHAAAGSAIGLEATGGYQEAVATTLHDAGYHVSVINPAVIAAYGASQLRRTKTDPVDAVLIADYVRTQTPPRWVPPPPEARQLQALVRRLDALLEMRTQELNRLDLALPITRPSLRASLRHLTAQIRSVRRQIAAHIDTHPTLRQQRDLIVSIPGIGAQTAATVLGELLDPKRFTRARQVAAFSGLVPAIRQSGTTLRSRGRLSKLGSNRLRKALYFPALTALRVNPSVRRFATRLALAGKPKLVIIAAVMRKLIHQVFGVLRSARPYDPRLA